MKLFTFFLTFTALTVHAQNLVPNPGFEYFLSCPGGYSQNTREFKVVDWRSANTGTPDYFNACSTGAADVPKNWAGISDAFDGNGYTGIYVWLNRVNNDYREYLQSKLLEPLTKDSTYIVEFHYKLSSYSIYSSDRIGVMFTDSMVTVRHDQSWNITPSLSVVSDSALTNRTGAWERGKGEYKAKGGEQFLTLGNFFNNRITRNRLIKFRPAQEQMLSEGSYYYIDGISVVPKYRDDVPVAGGVVPEFTPEAIVSNKTYILRNIQFEFDSYRLLPISFDELDIVAQYMLKHPKALVQLSGHTDDQGGDRYNLNLSRNRARSAAGYLTLQGIDSKRIETFGYGESRPLINETTDEARKTNRRVEVKFIE